MTQLPEEIVSAILSLAGSRAYFACGKPPNSKKMFLEGGPCIVLESILKHGGDIRSLLQIRQYVPPSIALCKAALTENITFVKRVCLIWNTRDSNDAYAIVCRQHFVWGINHLRPLVELTVHKYNRIYFEANQLDKIDLSVSRPFSELSNTRSDIKAERLDYLPFKMSLDPSELLYLYVLKDMQQEVYEILDDDRRCMIKFHDVVFRSINEGIYKLPLDLFQTYGYIYDLTAEEVTAELIRVRNVEALEYLNIPNVDIHRAIIDKEVDQLNEFLTTDRRNTLDIICKYDSSVRDFFGEFLQNIEIKMDRHGYWIGLSAETHQIYNKFNFGFYDTSDDYFINLTIERIKKRKIATIQYFGDAYGRYAPPSRILLSFIEMHGRQILDDVQNKLYIVPYLTYIDIESTCQLMSILLECRYPIKELYIRPGLGMPSRPAVYLTAKTIYYSCYPVDSHKCYLEDEVYTRSEFTDILFAKDIAVAFKVYSGMVYN